MPILSIYRAQRTIALHEFADVVVTAQILFAPTGDPLKLRLDIADGSFVDVFVSVSGRYAYHWDRRSTREQDIYRHDNAPHGSWRRVATFPKHFHDGSEGNVVESHLSDEPEEAMRQFLQFVHHRLLRHL